MVDRNTTSAAPPNHDRLRCTHRFVDGHQSLFKVTQSLGHSLPGGYIVVRVNDEGERVLHIRKSVDRLEEVTQLDQLREVSRRNHYDRKNDGNLGVAQRERAQADLLLHNLPKVSEHVAETLIEEAEFDRLAAVEGNALRMFSQVD